MMTQKRKKHKRSILHQKDGTCYLCIRLHADYRVHPVTHEHHVYGGPNRSISEAEGFKVHLCVAHHEFGKEAVHVNIEMMRLVQQDMQREFEKKHTRQRFMALIGRSYLLDDKKVAAVPVQENKEPGFVRLED